MKILFFNSPAFDYSSSQLNEGLYLLSQQGEIEYKTTHTNSHHGASVAGQPTIDEDEAFDNLDWADLLIFTSSGNNNLWTPRENELMQDTDYKHKKIFIDGCDSNLSMDSPDAYLLYFKRELRYPEAYATTLSTFRSLAFGVYDYLVKELYTHHIDYEKEWAERDIGISFMAFGASNSVRHDCAEILRQMDGQQDVKIVCEVSNDGQPVTLDKYHETLYRSKVGLSLVGAGVDTLRYWETPAHGAVLASMDIMPKIHVRNNFEPHRHAIFFQNWQQMAELVGRAVLEKERWIAMRKATDAHLLNHTTIHRAREVIEACKEVM